MKNLLLVLISLLSISISQAESCNKSRVLDICGADLKMLEDRPGHYSLVDTSLKLAVKDPVLSLVNGNVEQVFQCFASYQVEFDASIYGEIVSRARVAHYYIDADSCVIYAPNITDVKSPRED